MFWPPLPTGQWLQYHDWVNPIFLHPPQIKAGFATPSAAPGYGIEGEVAAVQRTAGHSELVGSLGEGAVMRGLHQTLLEQAQQARQIN